MMKKIFSLVLVILAVVPMYSQSQKSTVIQRNGAGIVNKAYFSVDDQNIKAPESASEFFQTYLNLCSDDSFVKHTLKSHDRETRHEYYEQFYKGIRVAGGSYVFHYRNGKITRVRGEFIPIMELSTIPSISKEEAMKAFVKYKGIPIEKVIDFTSDLLIMTLPSQSPDKKNLETTLAYKIYIQVDGVNSEEYAFVDAHKGNVMQIEKGSNSWAAYGQLETLYNGNVFGYTGYYDDGYHLVDSTRGAVIHTWDLEGDLYPIYRKELTDNDNHWGKQEHSLNRNYIAHDVHWALQYIYGALHQYYSRCSYDDNGIDINAYINYGGSVGNAHWLFAPHAIFIDKDTLNYRPLASLDMIAHEFGHGITYYNIGWGGDAFYENQNYSYQLQMDALNEGLSDIWAAILKYKITNSTNGIWQIGADVVPGVNCLRNIQYPNVNSEENTVTTFGTSSFYNGSNHARGGVFSRWFYLLAMGGYGTNGNGDYFNVDGIGLDNAANLLVNAVYEGELLYTKSFQEVRDAFMDIAIENGNTNLINSIANAWHAVGVGGMNISLSGPQVISSHGYYTVEGLPSEYNVVWSLTDNYYNYYCIQQATPSFNQCTITPDNNRNMENATLTATVKYIGDNVQILTKSGLYAYKGFKGTYSSSFGSGQYIAPNPIFTASNSGVHIYSPNLIGATVSYTGDAIPYSWQKGYNTLDVGMPSIGNTIVVKVLCDDGTQYTIPIVKSNNRYNMKVNLEKETVNVMLDDSEIQNKAWTVEISNAVTGEVVDKQVFTGNYASINTTGWKRGIYIVRVIVDKEVITEKLQIK